MYDPEGQLEKRHIVDHSGMRTTTEFVWNGAGFLVQVRTSQDELSFAYDAFGRRVFKATRASRTEWTWDVHVPLHERRESLGGSTQRHWVFMPESFTPAAEMDNSEWHSIICDNIGSPIAAYDARGTEVWSCTYDVLGNDDATAKSAFASSLRWPGQYHDIETGLSYNGFRYYDPSIGLYISPDPIGLLGGRRFYAYVPDPLIGIDPRPLVQNGGARKSSRDGP